MHHRAKVGIEERVPGRPDRIIERAGANVDEALSSFREQDGNRAVFKTRAVFMQDDRRDRGNYATGSQVMNTMERHPDC